MKHAALARGARGLVALAIACTLAAACESNDDPSTANEPISNDKAGDVHASAGSGASADDDAPTWNQDIAPIVIPKCTGCHQTGSIAPFSMTKYENAKPFAGAMAAAVMEGRMPPFLAQETDECQPRFPWLYDIRLSTEEKELIQRWADAGAPEGKPAKGDAPKSPPLPELEREDQIITIPQPVEVTGNRDLHTCMLVDPELTKDEYVVGRLIKPGNPKVVHHVVSYLVNPQMTEEGRLQTKAELAAQIKAANDVDVGGRYDCFGGPGLDGMNVDILDAWAPGSLPNVAPKNSGQPLSKDALLVFDLHYHPTGEVETDDSTSMALMFADDKPPLMSLVLLLGNVEKLDDNDYGIADLIKQPDEDEAKFLIPANAKDHVEEMTWQWKLPAGSDVRVYAVGTHMHYVGRDEIVTLERTKAMNGEPDQECLIETPAWDFNWQHGYAYDTDYDHYPTMRDGDTLRLKCTYDNTLDNPYMRKALDEQHLDKPVDVPLGEDTLDEMCVVGLGLIAPNL